jgi:large subunit ribosomal protein L33
MVRKGSRVQVPVSAHQNKNMATKKKQQVKLQCTGCKRTNYLVKKSKGQDIEKKLDLKKFCKWCKKHLPHKETKK